MSAPQQRRDRETERSAAEPPASIPPSAAPTLAIAAGTIPERGTPSALPHHRVVSIAKLTAEARAIHAERTDNINEVNRLNGRNAEISLRLLAINAEIHKHAYDGEPI